MQEDRTPAFDRKFESTLENVSTVVADLADYCLSEIDADAVGTDGVDSIELSVCEALTNVVRHAYDGADSGMIDLHCQRQGDDFVVRLRDQGKPIPSGLVTPPALPAEGLDLYDLPEGGMGVALIFELVDHVAYERFNGTNQLTLKRSVA